VPARWGTSAGVPRIWTPPSRSAARWCAGTGSWCRLAPGSWPTRIRHASSGRPRTRRRPCSRRWRSPRPEGEVYLAPVFKLLSTTGEQSIDLQLEQDRKSTRLNSSHVAISYAVFCLKKKKKKKKKKRIKLRKTGKNRREQSRNM